jgi:NRPS condensation-like uncharacterized protein
MQSSINHYERRLQGHERRHFRAPNSIIPIVVRIKGNVNKNNLTTAIIKAQQRHTLLRVRIKFDKTNTAWFTTKETEEIPIKIMGRTDDNQWISVCEKESKIPFDFHIRPPIRIILLYSPNKSDLILFCHHMFCDGLSVAYLARDIMQILGDPSKKLEILPPPPLLNYENIPDYVKDNVIIKKFIDRINSKWKNEEIVFDHNDYLSIFIAYWTHNTHLIQIIELSEQETDALINKCRIEHVSVNSMLFAAFLKAQYRVKEQDRPQKQKAGVAVDVRNKLKTPAGESFGFFAAGFIDTYKFKNNINFWEMTRRIHKRISKKLSKNEFFINLLRAGNLEPSIHDALIMKTYGALITNKDNRFNKILSFSNRKDAVSKMAKKFGAMHFGFAITNLGRLDFPRYYGNLELERLLIFPPTGPTIETTIFAATVSGKLTIVMSFVEEVIGKNEMVKLNKRLEDILKSF